MYLRSLADIQPGRLGGRERGGADCRRSRPGEGAGEGHPSRPARGYGGALEAPPSGSGALP